MRRGDFAAAWSISDRILRERIASGTSCFHWPRHLQYIWRGGSLQNRRVLVRCYHGLGDTIQFARFLRPLRAQAHRTILWAQPALLDLLRTVKGIDELLPLHDGTPECEYDVDIELMELGHYFRLTPEMIPREVPYIYESGTGRSHASMRSAPFARSMCSRDREAAARTHPCAPRHSHDPCAAGLGNAHVGIAWRSGDWDTSRSIPEDIVARLRDIHGVRWYSLQYGATELPVPASDMVDKSLALTARRMLSLDLVISVDTVIAHLAGALGLPVWTLLPYECDWRWMASGERSLWYPTMRLFRQSRPGDWSNVVELVSDCLLAEISATRARDTRSVGCTASSG